MGLSPTQPAKPCWAYGDSPTIKQNEQVYKDLGFKKKTSQKALFPFVTSLPNGLAQKTRSAEL